MLALAVAVTWPLARHLATTLPSDLGDPLLTTFILGWDADRFSHGFRGLWDAPFFFPLRDTLAFSDHLLGIAVVAAPVQWLTANPLVAYNVAFILSYALAGFGAYLLARSVWSSRPAAWVAGVAFLSAPHRALQVSHLQILASGWLALGLWGLHGYFARGSRRMLVVSVASSLLLALSSGYLMYFGLVALALAGAAGLVQRAAGQRRLEAEAEATRGSRPRWTRTCVDLAVACAAAALVLAPVAEAYLRVRQAVGLRRTITDMAQFSARWSDYVHAPERLWLWGRVLPAGLPERLLFPGLLVVLLASVALVAAAVPRLSGGEENERERRYSVGLYGMILALSVWLGFGPTAAGPYGWLAGAVPGFDGLRVPARAIVVVALALAVLAARGVQLALQRWHQAGRGRRVSVAAALTAAAIALEGYAGPLPLAPFDPRQPRRASLNAWLRSSPAGGVVELPIAGPAFEPFTGTYQFNTLLHGHPVVNGYAGTGYALQDFLASPTSPLARLVEIPDALAGLRRLGVRYLVLHRASYERWHRTDARALIDAVDAESGQVAGRVVFDDGVGWRLAEAPPATRPADSVRVGADSFTATASDHPEDARLAFDRTTITRWTTGRPKRGDEWFELAFDRERHVAGLVFRSERNRYAERPLRLVVEAIAADGSTRTLFEGSIVPQILAALGGKTDGAVVALPRNSTRALRLRQTGRGGSIPWAIEELEVRERLEGPGDGR